MTYFIFQFDKILQKLKYFRKYFPIILPDYFFAQNNKKD